MSRPASLRPSSSPILARQKQTGGKKLEVDIEKAEERYYGNHRLSTDLNLADIQRLRRELISAEARGADSKAKKVRREINQLLEAGLFVQGTFCGTCGLHLHRCRCKGLDQITLRTKKKIAKAHNQRQMATRIVHSILSDIFTK